MSNRVSSRRPLFEQPSGNTMTKNEKRQAAKEAKTKAALAAGRRKLATNAAVAVVVVAVIVGAFFMVRGFFASAPASVDPSASATPSQDASSTGFPSLPAGADQALATRPTVEKPTGALTELKVTTLVQGTGAAVQNGQKITVNYVGVAFNTGEEFDSSWKGSKTYAFNLGSGGVIKGWDEGLAGVKIGSRVQLDIPAAKAYGDTGSPGGPLRFVVDVLGAE